MEMPDFTPEQQKRLTELGVQPAQVEQLRFALIAVGTALLPAPARNDVRDTLADVAKQAEKLKQLLARLALHVDGKRSAACNAIEIGYWKRRPQDNGATSAHHLIPRLSALAEAAQDGIAMLPKEQTRHRTAAWTPIRAIEDALLAGWPLVGRLESDTCASAPTPSPYPKEFLPSESLTSAFSEIAAVCYQAAGAPSGANPQRAIREYLRVRRKLHDEALAALERALT